MGTDPLQSGEQAPSAEPDSRKRPSDVGQSAAFRSVRHDDGAPSEATLRVVRLVLVGLAGLGLASLLEVMILNLLPSDAVLRPASLRVIEPSNDVGVMDRQLGSGDRLISVGGAYWRYIPALCCVVALCVVSVLGGAGGLARCDGGIAAVVSLLGYAGPRLQGVVSSSPWENALVLGVGVLILIGSFGIGWLGSSLATRGMASS